MLTSILLILFLSKLWNKEITIKTFLNGLMLSKPLKSFQVTETWDILSWILYCFIKCNLHIWFKSILSSESCLNLRIQQHKVSNQNRYMNINISIHKNPSQFGIFSPLWIVLFGWKDRGLLIDLLYWKQQILYQILDCAKGT